MKRASREQIGRIVYVLVHSQIDHDLAQAIVTGDVRIMTEFEKNERYLKSKYPEHAEKIMEVLEPFFTQKLELKPADPSMLKDVASLTLWDDVSGCCRYTLGEFDETAAATCTRTIKDRLHADYLPHIREKLVGLRLENLIKVLDEVFFRTDRKVELHEIAEGENKKLLVRLLWAESLFGLIIYTCAFIIMGEDEIAAKTKPLFALWLKGNFPIGFDEDGKLLVLAAKG